MQGRVENLLGALVATLGDQLHERLEMLVGCGPSAPAALIAIARRPHRSIESLRQAVGLSHSATVRLTDRLEAEGMVTRRSAPDGREVHLVLTAKGRRRVARIHQERRTILTRALAGLSASDRRGLESLLGRLLRGQAFVHEDPTPICRLCDVAACPLRRCPVPGGR